MQALPVAVLLLIAAGTVVVWQMIRSRHMQYWLPAYLIPSRAARRHRRAVHRIVRGVLKPSGRRVPGKRTPASPPDSESLHVFLAVCDHYEPQWGGADRSVALQRIDHWVAEYPGLFDRFRDCRERPPQHTFFFPQDEYRPEYLDRLRKLCDAGFGDVDVHLHHDGDTADGFREKLERFRDALADRHGLLRPDPLTGRIVYGFIHGNWALCNSRPDRRWCGVNEEIDVLLRTGCYADFTMPSAPSPTQTRTINSIYYARQRPGPKSHDTGVPAAVGQPSPKDALLMIQGPLCLDWSSRKWGILPRTENGDIHAGFLPTLSRFRRWLDAAVHVWGRPDWVFVKLHTHGCKDGNRQAWLGERTQRFHRQLADLRARCPALRLYYVTAWEMACLVHQAEAGLREPDLENLAAGWADRCTTGAEPQPDSDAPRRSAARTAPAPQA